MYLAATIYWRFAFVLQCSQPETYLQENCWQREWLRTQQALGAPRRDHQFRSICQWWMRLWWGVWAWNRSVHVWLWCFWSHHLEHSTIGVYAPRPERIWHDSSGAYERQAEGKPKYDIDATVAEVLFRDIILWSINRPGRTRRPWRPWPLLPLVLALVPFKSFPLTLRFSNGSALCKMKMTFPFQQYSKITFQAWGLFRTIFTF